MIDRADGQTQMTQKFGHYRAGIIEPLPVLFMGKENVMPLSIQPTIPKQPESLEADTECRDGFKISG